MPVAKRARNKPKRQRCPDCGPDKPAILSLWKHRRDVHGKGSPRPKLTCFFCTKETNDSNRSSHVKIHHQPDENRSKWCINCHFFFSQASDDGHVKRKQSGHLEMCPAVHGDASWYKSEVLGIYVRLDLDPAQYFYWYEDAEKLCPDWAKELDRRALENGEGRLELLKDEIEEVRRSQQGGSNAAEVNATSYQAVSSRQQTTLEGNSGSSSNLSSQTLTCDPTDHQYNPFAFGSSGQYELARQGNSFVNQSPFVPIRAGGPSPQIWNPLSHTSHGSQHPYIPHYTPSVFTMPQGTFAYNQQQVPSSNPFHFTPDVHYDEYGNPVQAHYRRSHYSLARHHLSHRQSRIYFG